MVNYVLVFIGGGVGSVVRYLFSVVSGKLLRNEFAWGTLAVNLLGCLLIGILAGRFDRALLGRPMRVFLVTGFLGGFTTFSAFSYESIRLMQASPAKGLANIAANLAGGLALAALGLWIASK
jgi:CrcB protein